MKLKIERMKNYKPTDSHVLVKDFGQKATFLATPDDYNDPIQRAQVVAVGPKCKDVKPGDIVHYPLFASSGEIFPDGYANLAEESILGIEEGSPVVVQSKAKSGLDRNTEDNADTIKYLKELNVGKLLEKDRKRVSFDMGRR